MNFVDPVMTGAHVDYFADASISILVGADDMTSSLGEAFGTIWPAGATIHCAIFFGVLVSS